MKKMDGILADRRDMLRAGAGAAAAWFGGLPLVAQAAELVRKGERDIRFQLGGTEMIILSDGQLHLGVPSESFPQAPTEEVRTAVAGDGHANGEFVLEQNCVVVRRGDRVALIDTGMGPNTLFGPTTGLLTDRLTAAGVVPGSVTDVVLTHAHLDHAGGVLGRDGGPAFPRAQIHVTQADFEFWTNADSVPASSFVAKIVKGVAEALLPFRERIVFYKPGAEPVPGLVSIHTPGHTLGHCSIAVVDGKESVIVAGDALHHSMQMLHPDWQFAGDADGGTAVASRRKLLDMAATDGIPFFAFHFAYPGVGRVLRQGSAFRFMGT